MVIVRVMVRYVCEGLNKLKIDSMSANSMESPCVPVCLSCIHTATIHVSHYPVYCEYKIHPCNQYERNLTSAGELSDVTMDLPVPSVPDPVSFRSQLCVHKFSCTPLEQLQRQWKEMEVSE